MKVCHMEVTRRCNLRCLHCINGDTALYEMDTSRAMQAIDRLGDLGFGLLCLTGGEPLVREDLPLLINKASERGILVALITNGTLFDDNFIRNAGASLSGVTISIDGPRSAHDFIRGSGCFDRATNAIALANRYGLNVSASITVTALSIDTITETIRWLDDHGVSDVHMNDLNMTGNALANRELLEVEWDEAKRHSLHLTMQLVSGDIKPTSADTCLANPETICMSRDGDIYLCSELMTNRVASSGSIFDDDVEFRIRSQCEKIGPCRCKYTDFSSGSISVTLHNGLPCPHIGVDV
ncbi:MAG: radical SAM protein [Candidatus Berkelbacteria bacterium]